MEQHPERPLFKRGDRVIFNQIDPIMQGARTVGSRSSEIKGVIDEVILCPYKHFYPQYWIILNESKMGLPKGHRMVVQESRIKKEGKEWQSKQREDADIAK